MTEIRYTLTEFRHEVTEFRRLMGERSFWAQPAATREQALKGLGFVFLRTDGPEEDQEAARIHYEAAVGEYHQRGIMFALHPPLWGAA